MKKYYPLLRSLHLYFGLFISPFILIFSISVLVINHPEFFNKLHPKQELTPTIKTLSNFQLQSSDSLSAKLILHELDISGEIDWISKSDSAISFPVNKPGLNRYISFNTKTGKVVISETKEGVFRAMSYLHTMPGQHNVNMRGNSFFMKTWKVATDVFVYVVLFVSVTGVFLWYFLRPERTPGIYSFGFGFVFLIVLMVLLF